MAENKPDFSKIWASNSPLPDYSFSDSDYQRGWDFIGSQPPARTMFDALQRQNDLKFQHLNSNQWLIIQRNKTYALDDIAYSPKLPSWAFLECTSPGTTADIEPSFAGVAANDTITDGSVEWTVRKLGNEVADKANRDLSNLTETGRKAFFPSDTFVDMGTFINEQKFTAPANGFFFVFGRATSAGAYLGGTIGHISTIDRVDDLNTGNNVYFYLPAAKGDMMTIFARNVNSDYCRFIYAEGEVPV